MRKLIFPSLLTVLIPLLVFGCTTEDAGGAGVAGVLICLFVVLGLIGLFLFILWIITFVDCLKRDSSEFPNASENTKTIWIVVLLVSWVVGFSWIAAIVYYFMVMKKMPRKK